MSENQKWEKKIREFAQKNHWIVIGISGCTNSGKTNICQFLEKKLDPLVIIHQDKFFREEDDPEHIWIDLENNKRHQNWEIVQSVDWNRMLEKIYEIVQNPANKMPSFLVIDGHIIYNYKPLREIFDQKYFIEIDDKQTIFKRRIQRDYIPADPPGYFDQYVWPMYLKNKEDLKDQNDITMIDGSLDKESIFELILNDLGRKLFLIN
ncbi:hexaprenyldihydroxybenzoate methyltransferase [Sarcoptes scabiei]|nr:hexaprenyldihydroxybenzoate methyltransferase [Sarcoptes scabiei]